MTPKYLQIEIEHLTDLRKGMVANAGQWKEMPVTVEKVDASLAILADVAADLDTAEIAFRKLQEKSHAIVDAQVLVGNQVESLAKGIHATESEKLMDYSIEKRKEAVPLAVPGKAIIADINEDVDGEGFVLNIQALSNATDFEIWRGVSAMADALVLEPDQFSYIATTKKLWFADHSVIKGKRYFYRLRGFNRNGKGEWSSITSRVQ